MEDNIQLKREEVVGNEVVLEDIYPKTDTYSIEDSSKGVSLDETLKRMWDSINNKLSRIVNSVNGRTGVVVLDSTDVGLGNVDNVSFADIKDWVLNRLIQEFKNHRIKIYNNLNELDNDLQTNDIAIQDTAFFSKKGYPLDKDLLSYIGYIYWDEGEQKLSAKMESINVIGWADDSVIYNEKLDKASGEQDYRGGRLGVNIWEYEDALKLKTNNSKSRAGLYIDKNKITPRIIKFLKPYVENNQTKNPTTEYAMLFHREDQVDYDKGMDGYVTIVSGPNYARISVKFSSALGTSIPVKFHDIVVCDFIYTPLYINPETNQLYEGYEPELIGRGTMIGTVTEAPSLEKPNEKLHIYFYDIKQRVGSGLGYMSSHSNVEIHDTSHNNHVDESKIGIKLSEGTIEGMNPLNDKINLSGLNVIDNDILSKEYAYEAVINKTANPFLSTNLPQGPNKTYNLNEYGIDDETKIGEAKDDSSGLYIKTDASLSISPFKYYGPKYKGTSADEDTTSFNREIYVYKDEQPVECEEYNVKVNKGSDKIGNWSVPFDDPELFKNTDIDSFKGMNYDANLIGINLFKFVSKSSMSSESSKKIGFSNASGLRITGSYQPDKSSDSGMALYTTDPSFFGKTPVEMDINVNTHNEYFGNTNNILYEPTSGGISVNVGKFLEIDAGDYKDSVTDFDNNGKVNVRIGRGLHEQELDSNISDEMKPYYGFNYHSTDNPNPKTNKMEVFLDKRGGLKFNDNDDNSIKVKVNTHQGLNRLDENNDFAISLKISDISNTNNPFIRYPYIPQYGGGLRFWNGYVAIRLNENTDPEGSANKLHKGSKGLCIDDDTNVLGVQLSDNSCLEFDKDGNLTVDENLKKTSSHLSILRIIDQEHDTSFLYNPTPDRTPPNSYTHLYLGPGLELIGGTPNDEIPDPVGYTISARRLIKLIEGMDIQQLSWFLSTSTSYAVSPDTATNDKVSRFTEELKTALTNAKTFKTASYDNNLSGVQMAMLVTIDIMNNDMKIITEEQKPSYVSDNKFGIFDWDSKYENEDMYDELGTTLSDHIRIINLTYRSKDIDNMISWYKINVSDLSNYEENIKTITGKDNVSLSNGDVWYLSGDQIEDVPEVICYYLGTFKGINDLDIYREWCKTFMDVYNWMLDQNWFKRGELINPSLNIPIPTIKTKMDVITNDISDHENDTDLITNYYNLYREISGRVKDENSVLVEKYDNVTYQMLYDTIDSCIENLPNSGFELMIKHFHRNINYNTYGETVEDKRVNFRERLLLKENQETNPYPLYTADDWYMIGLLANSATEGETLQSNASKFIDNLPIAGYIRLYIKTSNELNVERYDDIVYDANNNIIRNNIRGEWLSKLTIKNLRDRNKEMKNSSWVPYIDPESPEYNENSDLKYNAFVLYHILSVVKDKKWTIDRTRTGEGNKWMDLVEIYGLDNLPQYNSTTYGSKSLDELFNESVVKIDEIVNSVDPSAKADMSIILSDFGLLDGYNDESFNRSCARIKTWIKGSGPVKKFDDNYQPIDDNYYATICDAVQAHDRILRITITNT